MELKNLDLIFYSNAGSRLYGTHRPDSDWDLRGVAMQPIATLLGLQKFEQYVVTHNMDNDFNKLYNTKSDDVTIYGLNKFLTLAMDGNPNIIELLFAPNLISNKYSYLWNIIVAYRDQILSNKIVHTFSGYAYSQLQRIKGHRKWIENPPSKPNPTDYGKTVSATGSTLWATEEDYYTYKRLLKDWQNYEIWQRERNPKRRALETKYGYDTKHAMHLVRLLFEAEDLLTTGELVLPLSQNKIEQLKAVMNGHYSYDEILELGESGKDYLKELEQKSVLNDKPNRKKIEELLIDINLKYIREKTFNKVYGVR